MIKLNGITTNKQPTGEGVREYGIPIFTDQEAINGNIKRHSGSIRWWGVDLQYKFLTVAQYTEIMDIVKSGAPVVYRNETSNKTNTGILEFTGLPSIPQESSYYRGSQLLVDLSFSIRQVA